MDVFQAVADPVRRSVGRAARRRRGRTAGELADLAHDRFGISQPTASKHLKVLREAGIVTSTVAAQRRVYRLEPRPLDDLAGWAARQTRFWNDRLDVLERHLIDDPGEPS